MITLTPLQQLTFNDMLSTAPALGRSLAELPQLPEGELANQLKFGTQATWSWLAWFAGRDSAIDEIRKLGFPVPSVTLTTTELMRQFKAVPAAAAAAANKFMARASNEDERTVYKRVLTFLDFVARGAQTIEYDSLLSRVGDAPVTNASGYSGKAAETA